jgi:hypothetical protein
MGEDIIVNVDEYGDWSDKNNIGVVIICASTGVMCTAQVGGMVMQHPEIEGYPVYLYKRQGMGEFKYFEDCYWGCWGVSEDMEHMTKYAAAIDSFLKEFINDETSIRPNLLFKFDYERIGELMEGWWPVLVQFKRRFTSSDPKYYDAKFKGYLSFGNCD